MPKSTVRKPINYYHLQSVGEKLELNTIVKGDSKLNKLCKTISKIGTISQPQKTAIKKLPNGKTYNTFPDQQEVLQNEFIDTRKN